MRSQGMNKKMHKSRSINKTSKKPRRRKRGFGRFIFLIVLIVLVVVGGVTALKHFSGESYDDEKSFEKYAKEYFSDAQEKNKIGEAVEKFNYGAPVSTAAKYPTFELKDVDGQIKNKIEMLNADYQGKYAEEDTTLKFAQLTTYDSYKSDKNTGSVVLKTVQREENSKGKQIQQNAVVNTFNFSLEKGIEIYPVMAFESGYQKKLSSFFDKYLNENYKGELTDGYKKYISADNKFEKFALNGDEAVFYFDAGTVVKGSEIISIEVKAKDIEGVFREKINPRNLDPSKPMVALTYDDGPAPGTSDRILDVFERNNCVATFFEQGINVENVKDSERILKRMDELDCEIGSHSYDHPNLFTISDQKVKEQNDKTDKLIEDRIGRKPTVYRPPFGNGNEKTTKIFNKPGILWSVDTMDWSSRNADAVINVVKSVKDLDGKVVLMHSLYDSSAKATEVLVPWLQKQGYQLVTVSELLTYKYHEDPTEAKFYGYNYFYLDK